MNGQKIMMSLDVLFGKQRERLVTIDELTTFMRSFDRYAGGANGERIDASDGQINQDEAFSARQVLGVSVEDFFSDKNAYIVGIVDKMMCYAGDDHKLSYDELKAGAKEMDALQRQKIKDSRGLGFGIKPTPEDN